MTQFNTGLTTAHPHHHHKYRHHTHQHNNRHHNQQQQHQQQTLTPQPQNKNAASHLSSSTTSPFHTHNQKHLHNFTNIEITKTQFLVRGGLALTPRNPKDANTILSREKWDLAFFGPHIYIHIAHKDQRPWYCINRIPLDMHDSLIRTALENHRTPSGHSIDPGGIHRNTKGPLPTTLYIFKVKDSTTGKKHYGHRYYHRWQTVQDKEVYTIRYSALHKMSGIWPSMERVQQI